MGLDFSHCDAHWAYSGFRRFRDKLAEQIGFSEYKDISTTERSAYKKIENDGILPLLAQSDCDGVLTPEECRKVAPRLRELVASWPEHDLDKNKALELADGMDLAAENDEELIFT